MDELVEAFSDVGVDIIIALVVISFAFYFYCVYEWDSYEQ